MQRYKPGVAILGGAMLAGMLVAGSAGAVDWSSIQATKITLFYPGQSSWESRLIPADHAGAQGFRQGTDCIDCHKGEEALMGKEIVSGKKLEPDPIPGKPGSLPIDVKAAYDQDRLYIQVSWKDTGFKPPHPQSDKLLQVNMMLGDGTVPSYTRGGCWATCHADLKGMPYAVPGKDLTKYLARSRTKVTAHGGDESYKSDSELKSMLNDDMFIEYWQAVIANRSAKAVPVDGYILAKRHVNPKPTISADASLKDGIWTVTLSRPLKASGPAEKNLAEGHTYYVGFSIHDGYAVGRRHYVAFKRTLTLGGGKGQLIAKKQ